MFETSFISIYEHCKREVEEIKVPRPIREKEFSMIREKEFSMIIDRFIGNNRESKKIIILAFSLEKAKKKIPIGWKMYQFMGVNECR